MARRGNTPTLVKNSADQQGSTFGRQSRMLVAVHPSSCLGSRASRQPQLPKSETDEQPIGTSQLGPRFYAFGGAGDCLIAATRRSLTIGLFAPAHERPAFLRPRH